MQAIGIEWPNLSCNRVSITLLCSAVKRKSVSPSKSPGETFVCPLSQVRVGSACRIKQLSASPEIAHRLREMGFCEEQCIKLLSQHHNIICLVCNVRLGISAELADSIWVEPIRGEEKVA